MVLGQFKRFNFLYPIILWHLRVVEELSKLEVQKSIYDEAIFFFCYAGKLNGIILTYAEDFFRGG